MNRNKPTIIEAIINVFNGRFSMDWIDGFEWDQNHEGYSAQECFSVIRDFETEVFYIFSQSILSGEYILRKQLLEKLDEIADEIQLEFPAEITSILEANVMTTFNDLCQSIQLMIKRYKHLITNLENKYSLFHLDYLVNAFRYSDYSDSQNKYSEYYDILFDVTKYDHFLANDSSLIKDLILHHSLLEKSKNSPDYVPKIRKVFSILDDKCLFLLKKLLIEDNKEFDYLIDFEPHHYDAHNISIQFFSKFDNAFEFYRQDSYSNEQFARNLEKKSYQGNIFIGELALLMKYYKDSNSTNESQINKLLVEFDDMYNGLKESFVSRSYDKYALNSLKNYMYNSRLSFMMKQPSYSYNQFLTDMESIETIQSQTGILNFYPYRKAIRYILALTHIDTVQSVDEFRNYINKLEYYIERFSKAIKWSNEQCFYPIQDVYAGCRIKVDDFGAVFVPSSFCRPIKYSTLVDECAEYKSRLLMLKNEISLYEEKVEIEEIKNDIDNSKTKNVEILSFFTAVITFLFGTIDFFSSNKTNSYHNLLINTFSLGLILLLFVSGVYFVILKKELFWKDIIKKPKAIYIFISSIAYLVLLFFLFFRIFPTK